MQRAKSTVYSSHASNAEEIGILLGFSVSIEGIVVARCPVAGPVSLHRTQSRLQKRSSVQRRLFQIWICLRRISCCSCASLYR